VLASAWRSTAHGGVFWQPLPRTERMFGSGLSSARGKARATRLIKELQAAAASIFLAPGRALLLFPRSGRIARGRSLAETNKMPMGMAECARPHARTVSSCCGHRHLFSHPRYWRRCHNPDPRSLLRRRPGENTPGGDSVGGPKTTCCGAAAKATRRCSNRQKRELDQLGRS